MNKADRKAVEGLHGALAAAMKERLEAGGTAAADLNVIRQFLKDNGVGLGVAPNTDQMDELAARLPFKTADELAAEDGPIQ